MKIGFRWLLAVVSIACFSSAANAYLTLDAIVPASPQVGETVAARVRAGICDGVIESPGYPQVSQAGNVIRLLLDTLQYDDPILCNIDEGTANIPFGEFPAGDYVLQLDRHYVNFFGSHIIETVGTLPFSVAGGAVVTPLPALGPGCLLVLALGLFALTALAFSRRHRAAAAMVCIAAVLPIIGDARADAEPDRYVHEYDVNRRTES